MALSIKHQKVKTCRIKQTPKTALAYGDYFDSKWQKEKYWAFYPKSFYSGRFQLCRWRVVKAGRTVENHLEKSWKVEKEQEREFILAPSPPHIRTWWASSTSSSSSTSPASASVSTSSSLSLWSTYPIAILNQNWNLTSFDLLVHKNANCGEALNGTWFLIIWKSF